MNSFKEAIGKILREMDVSQAELAKRLSISPQTLNISLSKGNPQLDTILNIAKALKVSPAYIFASEEERSLWELGRKSKSPLKDEIKALVDSLDDELKLKVLRASAQGIVDHGTDRDMLPKKLKKSS